MFKTVIDIVREDSRAHRDRPAVMDGPRRWTHAQLWDRVDRLARGLTELGLSKGDVVLAWLPNCHQAIESELACLQSGGVWVTLHAQLTWAEVSAVIAETEPKFLISSPELLANADPHHGIDLNRQSGLSVIEIGDESSERGVSYEQMIASSAPERPDVSIEAADLARLRYTSGTTGHTRAAMLTHGVYCASLELQRAVLHPLGPDDRVLHAAPLTHASGALIYPLLAAGGANVVLPRFQVEDVLATIAREHITTMFAVPTILQRLCLAPDISKYDLGSLRTITYGGAPMPIDALNLAIRTLPNVLVQIYGLTEALHPVTALAREEHRLGNPDLETIGKPTHLCDVKVLDDSGVELPDGEVGELWVKGPNVMAGYWRDDTATRETQRGGWVATGDLGYRRPDGYFRIVDRKKDVVVSGGFNVYSAEVEAALCRHPGVAEAAVFGVPHADWGEAVHAMVVPHDGRALTPADLYAFCRAELARYKTPKTFTVQTEPLPKTAAGKILKRELRDRLCRE